MKIRLFSLLLVSVFLFSLTYLPPQYGIESPSPIGAFLNDVFPKKSPVNSSWKLVNAFPDVTFVDPIAMADIPNDDGFYVAGKSGQIWYVKEDNGVSAKEEVLDIQEIVTYSGDAGLINFILAPGFGDVNSEQQNLMYIFYAYNPFEDDQDEGERMNVLASYEVFPNSKIIDPTSEKILIRDFDPNGFHMGGGMFFDNEGYLYLSWGDGGGENDEYNSTQQITERFWGGLIRIDVTNDPARSHPIRRNIREYPGKQSDLPESITAGYSIPNDNPWIDQGGGILEEFFALGFRSPHRATYDPIKEEIWVSDVGQGGREEITIVRKGGNAQWPYREGNIEGVKPRPDQIRGEENVPIYDYERITGNAVIGGFVYRGSKWKDELEGQYIFGDHGTRNIWTLNPTTNEVNFIAHVPGFGVGNKNGISSFSYDEEGNIYVLKLYGKDSDGGVIYRFEQDITEPEPIPQWLSETGAFADLTNLQPSSGLIPYSTINPLWSDGAVKQRWIAIPNDGVFDSTSEWIDFYADGKWTFPSGTVFIKHFSLPMDLRDPSILKKIETRFFIIDEDGVGYGITYRWNEEETDAYLLSTDETRDLEILDEMGEAFAQTWEFPSTLQCNNCHTANAQYILGVNTWQLNHSMTYPSTNVSSNQLETWNHLGIFAQEMVDSQFVDVPEAVSLYDESANLQDQVSSYLDANCAHCHQPNGVEGAFDARFTTPIAYKNLLNITGKSHNNPANGVIVKSGEPENSQLWVRDNSIGTNKMPPLAKTQVDKKWIEVLTKWIEGVNEPCFGEYLSDREWVRWAQNKLGPPELDMSNGGEPRGDGQVMSIAGEKITKGLGAFAFSEMLFNLENEYNFFRAKIGVDDSACDSASVVFEVYADDDLVYQSPLMNKGQESILVDVAINNPSQLKLYVRDGGDGESCDMANWGYARISRFKDSDNDGVCDPYDMCAGGDDTLDDNNNGIPDACDNGIATGGELEFDMYPNPFIENFTIKVNPPEYLISRASLTIYDVNGRVYISKNNLDLGVEYVFGAALLKGSYYVQVKAGEFIGTKQIRKE